MHGRRDPVNWEQNKNLTPAKHTSLAGASLWFALSYGGAILGDLAVNAIAARILGDQFGYSVIAVTSSTLLGQLGSLASNRGGLRDAARLAPGDRDGLRNLRRDVRAVTLTLLPAISLLTTAVTFVGSSQ